MMKLNIAGVIACISIWFSGCSTHPLPQDVTSFPISDLVHKIRCEAADNVRMLFNREKFYLVTDKFKAADKKLKTLKAEQKKQVSVSSINSNLTSIKERLKEIALRQSQIAFYIKNGSKVDFALEIGRLSLIQNELLKDQEKLSAEKKKIEKLNTQIKTDEKLFSRNDKVDGDNPEERGRYNPIYEFKNTVISYNFRFKITESNGLGAKGSIGWPVNIGLMTLGYELGDSKQRLAERSVKLADTFWELIDLDCPMYDNGANATYPIVGDIGLDEVFIEYDRISQKAKFSTAAKGEAYQDTIQFTTTLNGSVNPKLTLAGVKDHSLSSELTLSAKREDIHEVIVYITLPAAAKADEDAKMAITTFPDINVRMFRDDLGTPLQGTFAKQ